jgi:hypothetical protein
VTLRLFFFSQSMDIDRRLEDDRCLEDDRRLDLEDE